MILPIGHSPSTIRRYMVRRTSGLRDSQTWRTLIQNHAKELRACDFLTPYTGLFSVTFVFAIMEVGSRRALHINVPNSPTERVSSRNIARPTGFRRPQLRLLWVKNVLYGVFAEYGC
jgi:putative transposase